jgi:hypothetical protein
LTCFDLPFHGGNTALHGGNTAKRFFEQPDGNASERKKQSCFPVKTPCTAVFRRGILFGELVRGFDGWNTFDTDNNEKKGRTRNSTNGVVLCCCSSQCNALALFPPCTAVLPPWKGSCSIR